MQELTDDQLDAWILARLRSAGVDLEVLPGSDPDAPVDRERILRSARDFLRRTPPVIAALAMDPQDVVPALYPPLGARSRRPGN